MSTSPRPTLFEMQRCRACGNTRRRAGGNCPTCGQRNFIDYLAGPCGRCGVHRHGLEGACSACGYTRGSLRPDEQAPTFTERLREFWKRIRRMSDDEAAGDAAGDGETVAAGDGNSESDAAGERGIAPPEPASPEPESPESGSPPAAASEHRGDAEPAPEQPETFTERVPVAAVAELWEESDPPDQGNQGDQCEHCDLQPEHHRHCDQCGRSRIRTCRACNTANRAIAVHCRHCGRLLDTDRSPESATSVAEPAARGSAVSRRTYIPQAEPVSPPPSTTASYSAAVEALG